MFLASLARLFPRRRRRIALATAVAVCAALAVFPRRYTARVQIIPPQSSSAGLGALLSQLGGLSSFAPLLSSRQPVEVYLVLARSNDVAVEVVRRLGLQDRFNVASREKAVRELESWADIHSLRGGVIEIEATGTDAELALGIARTYAAAFQDRLSVLAKDEVARKRALMTNQLQQATDRLDAAEASLTRYRTVNRVASPEAQLGSSVSLLAQLRARLQAREVELTAARNFATDDNFEVQRVQSEIAGLRREIDRAEQESMKKDPFGFQSFAKNSSEYLRLYRDAKYAEALYEVYSRYLEAVNVEEVSASINAQIVESPHLDPRRGVNASAAALALAFCALALFFEYRTLASRTPEQP